jgi:hypothetical protein
MSFTIITSEIYKRPPHLPSFPFPHNSQQHFHFPIITKMAILSTIPGLIVSVAVDKQKLQEYYPNPLLQSSSRTQKTESYIESQSGVPFVISVRITEDYTSQFLHSAEFPDLSVEVFLDGDKAYGALLHGPSSIHNLHIDGTHEWINGQKCVRPWTFADITTCKIKKFDSK